MQGRGQQATDPPALLCTTATTPRTTCDRTTTEACHRIHASSKDAESVWLVADLPSTDQDTHDRSRGWWHWWEIADTWKDLCKIAKSRNHATIRSWFPERVSGGNKSPSFARSLSVALFPPQPSITSLSLLHHPSPSSCLCCCAS